MKVRPTMTSDGRQSSSGRKRCWLDESEQQLLIDIYDEDPVKQAGIRLSLEGGCRVGECIRITKSDFERIETEDGDIAWSLRVVDSKGDDRVTRIGDGLKKQLFTLANAFKRGRTDPILGVSSTQIRNLSISKPDWWGLSKFDTDPPLIHIPHWGYYDNHNRLTDEEWDECIHSVREGLRDTIYTN